MENELSSSNYELIMEMSNIINNNDQTTPFESVLSSMVSSPSFNGHGENKMMIKELIGRLGTICDNGTYNYNDNSCYNTPISSPSKFIPSSYVSLSSGNDPGFIDRAARFSSFGNGGNSFGGLVNGDSREGSSVSEQNPGVELTVYPQNNASSRKRKSVTKSKVKAEVKNEESDAKRSKVEKVTIKKETSTENNNNNNNNNNKKEIVDDEKKDYIHVRARRGQATDSHSLAERVRREKISERMKFLQDLVPGCNKVTGKATVLDEIINYVQSLQRQVEFLSMKLSTVNPRVEFDMEALLSKDMFQSRMSSFPQAMYSLDQNSGQKFPFVYQSMPQIPSLPFSSNPNIQLPSIGGFPDSLAQPQLPTLWEDNDLQSIVQMGIVPNPTQSLPGTYPTNAQMKVEL